MKNIGGCWLTNLLIVSTVIDQMTFLQGQQFLLKSQWLDGTVVVAIGSIEVLSTTLPLIEIHRTVRKFRTQTVVNVGS